MKLKHYREILGVNMHNINEHANMVAYSNTTIKDSLKLIDENCEGLLFIVDNSNKLLGALSDGDIRRALISGKSLQDTIIGIFNQKPYFVYRSEYKEENIKKIMIQERYEVIPILNDDNSLLGYVTWDDILSGEKLEKIYKKLDIPVVIMAGGKGTRMAPFTNVLPKPLIPIGEKTILEVIIEQFRKHQINDYYFTINFKGSMIKAYFDGLERSYKVNYLQETDFFGTAGSLKLLPNSIKGPILVTNCDIIVKADYSDIFDFHKASGASITVVSSIQHHVVPYGVIKFSNGGRVNELLEKPEYSFCINTGVYIVDSSCLQYIPDDQIFHMTDLIEKVMALGKVVSTYPVNESEYIDVGQWNQYKQAVKVLDF